LPREGLEAGNSVPIPPSIEEKVSSIILTLINSTNPRSFILRVIRLRVITVARVVVRGEGHHLREAGIVVSE
jgi:hypothetical protein